MTENRQKAIEGLRKLSRPLPQDFRFNREEAHARRAFVDTQFLLSPKIKKSFLT
jgi:hypothetical protein